MAVYFEMKYIFIVMLKYCFFSGRGIPFLFDLGIVLADEDNR